MRAIRRACEDSLPTLASIAQHAVHRIAIISLTACVNPIRPQCRQHRRQREARSILCELERPKEMIRNCSDVIAKRRCTKARMKLDGATTTAGFGIAFTYDCAKARACENRGCGQSLHTRANDCGVVRFHSPALASRPTRIISDALFLRG